MSLTQLLQIVPPPANPIVSGDSNQWVNVERDLKTPLPNDYKQLINVYGTGFFGRYVCPYNPFLPSDNMVNTVPGLLAFLEKLRQDNPEDWVPFPTFPNPGGLFPWGRDDNAGNLFWLTDGKPDDWPIIICDSHLSEYYHRFDGGVTEFLVAWLTGRFVIDFYPEDIYPLERVFRPSKTGILSHDM